MGLTAKLTAKRADLRYRFDEVMDAFWELGRTTSVEIPRRLLHLHISTVSTTIRSLVAKGFVVRETASRRCDGNVYTSVITKEELMLQAVRYMLKDLHDTPAERRRLTEALHQA